MKTTKEILAILKRNYEIIGHTLALSDVLKAMGGAYMVDGTGYVVKKTFPEMARFGKDGKHKSIKIKFDLSKPLLRDQEPKTIDAIYEILIPTK